jgi:predicted nucleotidyltransferase
MDTETAIAVLRQHASELRERGVSRLALFGSVGRGEARMGSDVDLLVDIDPSRKFSLFDLAALRLYISDILGTEVDLVQRGRLKPLLRDAILREAVDVLP